MENPTLEYLQKRDADLAQQERLHHDRLQAVREVRKAIAVLIADAAGSDLVSSNASAPKPITTRVLEVKQVRPRRGWTKIIRDVLTVHPDITFKQLVTYAREGGMEPEGTPDFEDRMRFALRDMTSKGFTIRTKGERKALSTYALNLDK